MPTTNYASVRWWQGILEDRRSLAQKQSGLTTSRGCTARGRRLTWPRICSTRPSAITGLRSRGTRASPGPRRAWRRLKSFKNRWKLVNEFGVESPEPGMSLSYREIIDCRYIRLFSISKSISYRTSHIEYLDMPSICLYFVFFRRKFSEKSENSLEIPKILRKFRKFSENSENSQKFLKIRRKFWKFAENSENSPKIRRKFWKFAENSPKIQKIRRKFWKFAENSSKRRSSLRPSYRIVSYRIEKKTLISYRYRIESKKSLSLLSGWY